LRTPQKGWSRTFTDPIPLSDGGQLVTLRDAANYITKLPKAKHDAPAWQAAIEALILVAEHGGPTMFARIGVMRALYPKRRYGRGIPAHEDISSHPPSHSWRRPALDGLTRPCARHREEICAWA
jgi:hypothetical protein